MSTATSNAAAKKPVAEPSSAKSGAWFPPWNSCLAVVVLLVTIPLIQTLADEIQVVIRMFDGAAANIASAILAFIAAIILYIWFCWRSSYSFPLRRTVFAAPFVFVVSHTILRKYEGVDGYMVPSWSWRFSKDHEATLAEQPLPAAKPLAPAVNETAPIENQPAPGADLATETADDFPQFLGPQRNNWLPDAQLAEDWSQKPPKEIWRRDVGPGWSGFSVRNGLAVTIEQRGDEEWTTCYRVDTGEPVWHHAVKARHMNPLGGIGPRSTPTIDGGRVYSQGATGIVCCLDGASGDQIWRKDLLEQYKLDQVRSEQLVQWGRAGSPLIVGDLLIVPAGGEGDARRSLVAFNKETGAVAWEAGDDQISYASPRLATIGGVQQIISVNEVTLTGHDIATGKTLWKFDWYGSSSGDANVSQGFPLAGDRIFISKGYGMGSALLELRNDGGQFAVQPLWESRRAMKTKFTNPTIIGNYVYGLSDGILECIELDSGKSKWKGGRYGHGQVLGVGSQLLVLGEDGDLMLVAASPEKFEERGKIQALTGKTWNNLCLTGKRLIIRNGTQAVCYELP